MGISFTKMHGAGNDFVLLRMDEVQEYKYDELAISMCDRHFGIGADGIMVVEPSSQYDVKMVYYNSDGSMGEMCGNGIRCFTKFIYDNNIVKKDKIDIETAAGLKTVKLKIDTEGNIDSIKVDMGLPITIPSEIPVLSDKNMILEETLTIDSMEFKYSALLVGVPHLVIFQDEIHEETIQNYGPKIETHEYFPRKANVNFVKVIDRKKMLVETWERGAGRTLACGTGVCSCVFTAHKLGKVDSEVEVTVSGGNISITIAPNGRIFMEGPADLVCKGEYLVKI